MCLRWCLHNRDPIWILFGVRTHSLAFWDKRPAPVEDETGGWSWLLENQCRHWTWTEKCMFRSVESSQWAGAQAQGKSRSPGGSQTQGRNGGCREQPKCWEAHVSPGGFLGTPHWNQSKGWRRWGQGEWGRIGDSVEPCGSLQSSSPKSCSKCICLNLTKYNFKIKNT